MISVPLPDLPPTPAEALQNIAAALGRIADVLGQGITVTIQQEGYEPGFLHLDVHTHVGKPDPDAR